MVNQTGVYGRHVHTGAPGERLSRDSLPANESQLATTTGFFAVDPLVAAIENAATAELGEGRLLLQVLRALIGRGLSVCQRAFARRRELTNHHCLSEGIAT